MNLRSRTSGAISSAIVSAPWSSYDKTACAGSLFWTSRTPNTKVEWSGERRYMADVVTPGFKKRSAAGEVIMSYMTSYKASVSPCSLSGELHIQGSFLQCPGPNQYYSQYKWTPQNLTDTLNTGMTPVAGTVILSQLLSSDEIERAVDEASTRCHNNRGRPEQNTWETVAEWRQTTKLLGGYLKAGHMAASLIDKHISKASIAAERTGRALTDGYLMTRYGLLPVVRDVQGAIAGLSKETGRTRQTVRGFSKIGRSSLGVLAQDFTYATANGQSLLTDELEVRAMSLDEWVIDTAANLGFSMKGLITLPWELLTLSFVADWFANIGDFFGASLPVPGSTQLGSCIKINRTQSLTNTILGATPTTGSVVFTAATGQKTATVLTRTRNPGLRNPSLIIRPRFGLDPELERNWQRIADSAALLGQRLIPIASKLARAAHHGVKSSNVYTE